MAGVFEADNTVDYTTLFEPTASQVAKAGKGYVVASIGLESGEIPYTAFCASKSYMSSHSKQVSAFLRALKKGYDYIKNNDSTTVARALAPSFEGFTVESLADTIDSYVEIDAWADTPVMKKAAFERLQDVMENAGELTTRAPFDKIVDNSLASALESAK
jgi:NitT/TauT family transport system substrate-binding protein